MGDLKSPRVICLKGFLFLVSGLLASLLLVLQNRSWGTALLVGIAIWSFCRLYYFLFYVVEHYVDPEFRYSGLIPMLKYVLHTRVNKSK